MDFSFIRNFARSIKPTVRKGIALGQLPSAFLALGVAGAIGAVMATVTRNIETGTTGVAATVAANATEGISQAAQQLDLVGLIIGLGAAIGVIFLALQMRGRF